MIAREKWKSVIEDKSGTEYQIYRNKRTEEQGRYKRQMNQLKEFGYWID
jgi:hypothetical protein